MFALIQEHRVTGNSHCTHMFSHIPSVKTPKCLYISYMHLRRHLFLIKKGDFAYAYLKSPYFTQKGWFQICTSKSPFLKINVFGDAYSKYVVLCQKTQTTTSHSLHSLQTPYTSYNNKISLLPKVTLKIHNPQPPFKHSNLNLKLNHFVIFQYPYLKLKVRI